MKKASETTFKELQVAHDSLEAAEYPCDSKHFFVWAQLKSTDLALSNPAFLVRFENALLKSVRGCLASCSHGCHRCLDRRHA